MTDLSLLNHIVAFSIVIFGLWVAFLVYYSEPKNRSNQAFASLTILYVFWILLAFLANFLHSQNTSLILMRIRFSVVSLFFISAYLFPTFFPYEEKRNKILDFLTISAGLTFAGISVTTNWIVRDIEIQSWGIEIIFGKGSLYFYAVIILLTFIIAWQLFKKYLRSSRDYKTKLQYFLVGVFVSILVNFVFNVVFPLLGTYRYYQIGDYSIVFIVALTAYAIVKKQLFGIKVVLTQLLVGLIAILLFADFLSSASIFEYAWKGVLVGVFIFFGWLLIRSVKREIKQREALDDFSRQLSQANARLKTAYAKLKELDKAKSEFISIASHQLRTPLTAIKGYVSMLIDGDYGKLPKDGQQPMKNVYASNERLVTLVNSLLDISRIEAGKVKYEESEFSLKEMAESLVSEFTPAATNKKLSLALDQIGESDKFNVKADQGKLRQVIANLIDNAIKYTNKGSITLSLIKKDKLIRIEVKDTGEGMEAKEIASLFQSFSRSTAGQKLWIEGTGLGLYIARKFIDMHQGKIWAESEGKGKGSKFCIELPIEKTN